MFAHSKQIMRANGNLLQWAGNYPDERQIRQDMERGVSFMIEENGKPVGTFVFIIGEDPTYAHIESGAWPENTPLYGTLHRIACAPGTHRIVSDCIRYGFHHISCLRIDTHADNRIMQHIVEQEGFQYCGIIHVADGTPRKAYQLTRNRLTPTLQEYIEKEIVPRYAFFDKAHRETHVRQVIQQSLELAAHYPVALNMVYAIAAFHDTGLAEGRDTHHLVSGRIIRTDRQLRNWFREEEIETMAAAAEDHRASSKQPPRSIYGKIVAEADRQIDTEEVVRRTIQYALSHVATGSETDLGCITNNAASGETSGREAPASSVPRNEAAYGAPFFHDPVKACCWQHTLEHLQEKYAEGGYLKLWIPESPNAERLAQLRALIADKEALACLFDHIYESETKQP